MEVYRRYLQKHALFGPWVKETPAPQLLLSVVIPCYDEPGLLMALESLMQCEPTNFPVEILVVINDSETDSPEIKAANRDALEKAKRFAATHSTFARNIHIIHATGLPRKDAGVGLARKIGMDEAVRRFLRAGSTRGIIAGFDADCTCSANYLKEIEKAFVVTRLHGASLYFEHPLGGDAFDSAVYESVRQYEIHLRYYKNALKYTGFPFAYHTVGSSFAITAETYCRQGGMNKRKAGEDFYFLSKVIPLGNYGEINAATVYPSPRPSHRVPFGTGAAVKKMLVNEQLIYKTYPFELFGLLKDFFARTQEMYETQNFEFPENVLGDYCRSHPREINLQEIRDNTSGPESFTKRFFCMFDAFRILKFLNFALENGYTASPAEEEARKLLGLRSGDDVLEWLKRTDRD